MSKFKPEPRFHLFYTPSGGQIALDLDLVDQIWEGDKPNTIVFVDGSRAPVVVYGDYNLFMEATDHYDCRTEAPPAPEQPEQPTAKVIQLVPEGDPE